MFCTFLKFLITSIQNKHAKGYSPTDPYRIHLWQLLHDIVTACHIVFNRSTELTAGAGAIAAAVELTNESVPSRAKEQKADWLVSRFPSK